jgi:hypothetical protein
MNTRCPDIEEIARLLLGAAGDDTRRHVDACARCSALALQYAAFLRAAPAEGADVADAEQRLAAFIADRIEAAPSSAREKRPVPRRWFDLAPRRGFMLAAAAVAVVVTALVVMRGAFAPDDMILRGSAVGTQLPTYTVAANGSIPLVWEPVVGADSYRITILGENLDELTEIGPITGNVYEFKPAEHAIGVGRYFWEVTALASGDSVGSAGPAPLFVR